VAATALLFDRDDVEELDDWTAHGRIGRSSILWVDFDSRELSDGDRRALAESLGLSSTSIERLRSEDNEPYFRDLGSYLHVTAFAPLESEQHGLLEIDCLVGERWVVTVHDDSVPVLESFRERAAGSGETGRLHGLEFLADVLDWVLVGYLDSFEDVERQLEELDARAMEGRAVVDIDASLRRLVELRHRIGWLRRALVAHRELVLALTRSELSAISTTESAARFNALHEKLEGAVQSARDTRDSVVGSFDLLLTRTGQRTNEIMKVLTLASVLLLPGSLIAGILGMNFKLGLFQNDAYFVLVLAVMAGIAAATLGLAHARRWI
jgi:Mg2+ and Co2+ transporter CorA